MKHRFRSALVFALLLGSGGGCDSTTPLSPTSSPPTGTGTLTAAGSNPQAIEIQGHVSDKAWRPLAGVRVEVLDGPDAGLSTVTDAYGEFRLVGKFDLATRFRASSPQHREVIRTLPPRCESCPPTSWRIYFSLETTASSVDMTGKYVVTLVADPACTTLPDQFRKRTYAATILPTEPQSAARFHASVGGGTFLAGYDQFVIGVAGDAFAAWLGDFYSGSPGVAERVETNSVLAFVGFAQSQGVVDGATVSASLDGTISYCELQGDPPSRYTCLSESTVARVCTSAKHQLILQRTASNLP